MHEKEQVFRDASYYVDTPGERIHFRVDVHCPALDALLAELGVAEAAFITACNPGATARDASANRRAQQGLEDALRARGYRLLPGAGAAPESGTGIDSAAGGGPAGAESGTGIDSAAGGAVNPGQPSTRGPNPGQAWIWTASGDGKSGTGMDHRADSGKRGGSVAVPDSEDPTAGSMPVPDSLPVAVPDSEDRTAGSMPVPDSFHVPDSFPDSLPVPDSLDSALESWPPEASCLVAGLGVSAAREIASTWGQVAWVHIMPGMAPQLLFTGPTHEEP